MAQTVRIVQKDRRLRGTPLPVEETKEAQRLVTGAAYPFLSRMAEWRAASLAMATRRVVNSAHSAS